MPVVVLLALLLGLYVWKWARDLYGQGAGLLALFFFAASPTLIAHSRLVTTDLGLAVSPRSPSTIGGAICGNRCAKPSNTLNVYSNLRRNEAPPFVCMPFWNGGYPWRPYELGGADRTVPF